jgi:rubrerythrin
MKTRQAPAAAYCPVPNLYDLSPGILFRMTTRENLMAAFAGESRANRKYAAFSAQAKEEGYPVISRLFAAASQAEAIHARRLFDLYGASEPTVKNLEESIKGETYESTEMYPSFLARAVEEKNTQAAQVFTYAQKAEAVHAALYKEALAAVSAGHDLDTGKVYVCPICGYIAFGKPPFKCPICSVFAKQFREVVL